MKPSAPLFTHARGNPSAPPVVLLHGFMGSSADWDPVAVQLSRDFYCIAPDWPGHGRTPLAAADSIGYAQWNAALADTLDALGLDRVALVGYSMGGRLALDFALRYPARVRALVAISANPGIDDLPARAARRRWDAENARLIQSEGMAAFLQGWYDLPLFASLENYPGLKDRLRARRGGQDPAAMAAVIQGLSPGRQPSLWPQLSSLRVPTLALCGALDAKYTAITARMAAVNPRIRPLTVPRAGHAIHVEQPARLIRTLRTFLCSLHEQQALS